MKLKYASKRLRNIQYGLEYDRLLKLCKTFENSEKFWSQVFFWNIAFYDQFNDHLFAVNFVIFCLIVLIF